MSALADKGHGLTIISGQPEHFRTFVATALSHTVIQRRCRPDSAAGLDIHSATEFVPLPGVAYLHPPMLSVASQDTIRHAWRDARERPSQCLILNGVLNSLTEFLPEILASSEDRYVIVADEFNGGGWRVWKGAKEPIHSVIVSPARQHPGWIQIRVQASCQEVPVSRVNAP